MSVVKIEALEPFKSSGYSFDEGDRKSVPIDLARRWCAAGWCKDVSGEIPTGDRRVTKSVIEPAKSESSHTAEDVSNG